MVNENLKLVEIVQELEKQEIKKSPLSPAARGKVINKSGSNYASDNKESYGPMAYYCLSGDNILITENTILNIEYSICFGRRNRNYFFEMSNGDLTTSWKINGNLDKLRDKEYDLNVGKIKLVKLNYSSRNYERVEEMEREVKDQLREDIRRFDLARRNRELIRREVSASFAVPLADAIICYDKSHSCSFNN